MAQRRRAPALAAPLLRTASKTVYSYLVGAISKIEVSDLGQPLARLTFTGRLAKKDGYVRQHLVIVENSIEQPDLVAQVHLAIRAPTPQRMLVSFEREMVPSEGGPTRLHAIARVEEVIGAARRDDRQLCFAI